MNRACAAGKALAALAAALLLAPAPGAAQNEVVTPYWASIAAKKARARSGPDRGYQIVWVYQRQGLPVKVVKRYGIWRQVRDQDGDTGWIHANLLSRDRTAVVVGSVRPMMAEPSNAARLLWRLEPGVVGKLGDCEAGWCAFAVDKREGWVRQAHLWGAGES